MEDQNYGLMPTDISPEDMRYLRSTAPRTQNGTPCKLCIKKGSRCHLHGGSPKKASPKKASPKNAKKICDETRFRKEYESIHPPFLGALKVVDKLRDLILLKDDRGGTLYIGKDQKGPQHDKYTEYYMEYHMKHKNGQFVIKLSYDENGKYFMFDLRHNDGDDNIVNARTIPRDEWVISNDMKDFLRKKDKLEWWKSFTSKKESEIETGAIEFFNLVKNAIYRVENVRWQDYTMMDFENVGPNFKFF